MAYDYTDKIALVTGASRGLGFSVAQDLAARGAHVIALARTVGALEELDDRIQAAGGQATLAPIDITKEDAMAGICRAIYDRWGRIDLLVHCAAHAAPLSPTDHSDPKAYGQSFSINAEGTLRVIRMVAPLLQAAPDGRAVFCDDARAGQKFFTLYGASKAAARAMVESWAAETARIGPKVTLFTPRPMATSTRARFFPGEDKDALARPEAEAARLLDTL